VATPGVVGHGNLLLGHHYRVTLYSGSIAA
jgi:hypothetical protein